MATKEQKEALEDYRAKLFAEMEITQDEENAMALTESFLKETMKMATDAVSAMLPDMSQRSVVRAQVAALDCMHFWIKQYYNE